MSKGPIGRNEMDARRDAINARAGDEPIVMKEPCPLCAVPFTTVAEDEFPCVLCDDTGEVDPIGPPPADGIYLCGACQRGDTENCSGWCGIKPTFPEKPEKA